MSAPGRSKARVAEARSAEARPVSRYDWPTPAVLAPARTTIRRTAPLHGAAAARLRPRRRARGVARRACGSRSRQPAPRPARARTCGSRSARSVVDGRRPAGAAHHRPHQRARGASAAASGCTRRRRTAASGTRATAARIGARSPGSRPPPRRASRGRRIAIPATPSPCCSAASEAGDEVWVGTGEVSAPIDGQPGSSLGGIGILHALHPAAPDRARPVEARGQQPARQRRLQDRARAGRQHRAGGDAHRPLPAPGRRWR